MSTTEVMHDVIVIGCGFAGIGIGIALSQQKLGSFVILESADEVGGTWRDNVYPGVAVDIPSFTYSFSFEPKPDWSRLFAPGKELRQYAHDLVDKYGLRRHIRFGSRVQSARLSSDERSWEVALQDGRRLRARFVISATGLLTQPKLPALPGLATFEGTLLHSARWPVGLDVSGKRVGIIGTGATTVQLAPELARQAAQLTVFQRTPIWLLPKLDAPLPSLLHRLFRRNPATQKLARLLTTGGTELVMVLAIVYQRQVPQLVKAIEATCLAHLRRQVRDPKLREALTPDYGFGCKRPSFSNTYLATFNEPHVSLETAAIQAVTPRGVQLRDGRELPFDVLVCATGFQTYEKGNLPTYAVHGRDGCELSAFWEAERYQAYQGATVPNFPNFFMMVGPYAATGSSWFSIIENQSAHIIRCLRHAQRVRAHSVEITPEAHQRFFDSTQRRLRNTVFYNNQCAGSNSYYFDKHGDALFYRPASGLETYLHSRLFRLSNYRFATQLRTHAEPRASTLRSRARGRASTKDLYDGP